MDVFLMEHKTRLIPAPFVDSQEYQIIVVREFREDEVLEIPKGMILSEQLGRVTADNYSDNEFYAVKALRFLISGFHKYETRKINFEVEHHPYPWIQAI